MKSKMLISLSTMLLLITSYTHAQTFLHNIEQAKTTAAEKEQPILMVFSGSDWCKPCIQLKEKVLTQTAFTTFANDNLVLLELDFPYRRKNKLSKEQTAHNEKLAEQYNPKGQFPMMVLIDAKGNLITELDYNNLLSAQDYIRLIQPKI